MSVHEDEINRRERRERMPVVMRLYLEGNTVRDIAARLQLSKRVIYRDIELSLKEFGKETDETVRAWRRKELARLEAMEREAWERHRDAIGHTVEVTKTKSKDGNSTRKHRKKLTGDPRWMDILIKLHEKREKLLKLARPEKVPGQADAGEMTTEIVEVVVETREQVQGIISYNQYQDFKDAAAKADGGD